MFKIVLGVFLGLGIAGACYCSYFVGTRDGRDEVVSACSQYYKYRLPDQADTYLYCGGPVNTEDMAPGNNPYKPYTQEGKDKYRKMRK